MKKRAIKQVCSFKYYEDDVPLFRTKGSPKRVFDSIDQIKKKLGLDDGRL